MGWMRSLVLAGLMFTGMAGHALAGPEWIEGAQGSGDAGSQLSTGQPPRGNGALGSVRGTMAAPAVAGEADGDFEDVFLITIIDPTIFSAQTGPGDGGAPFNTQLWLFDPLGFGLLANDDIDDGNLFSRITPLATDGTGQAVKAPGLYMLVVTGFNNDPSSPLREIFVQADSTEISGPDGPGAPLRFNEWSGGGEVGEYSIQLVGAEPGLPQLCPADFNGDSDINGADLGVLLLQFGVCNGPCEADLTGNGVVNGNDLGQLLLAWGPCIQCGGPGAGPCEQQHPGPFCNNATLCAIVCSVDPTCCQTNWDQGCVDILNALDLIYPANDDCEDANSIGNGATPFNTTNATTDGPAHPDACDSNEPQIGSDIWFNYTATCTGDVIVSTCGSLYNTELAVYDGCDCPASDGNLLGCNDDFCGDQSLVKAPVVAGQCYAIRVGGFNGIEGAGTLTISCSSCPAPGGGLECNIAQLHALDGQNNDNLGQPVTIECNIALAGAADDDDNGTDSGSAYAFRFDGVGWAQDAKLLASDGQADDSFGSWVALSGTRAIIGAPRDDDNGAESGSAYIFRRDTLGQWEQEAKLLPNDGSATARFGGFVGIDGSLAVVGARGDDLNLPNAGAAYIFRREGLNWVQEAKLVAGDAAGGDLFGVSVAISGDIVLVGAQNDDDNGLQSGSAYAFRRVSPGVWVQEAKLKASDGNADAIFGCAVAIDGSRAIIGARGDNDFGAASGSAYAFRRGGSGNWTQEDKLLAGENFPPGGQPGDAFGTFVDVSGNLAVVGAQLSDFLGADTGAVYLFRRVSSVSWVHQATLLQPGALPGDIFGACSISDDAVVVGAHGDDSDVGSAYVFIIDDPDCNGNGIDDACDIASGISADNNLNDIPDECEGGPCPVNPACAADVDGSGSVDAADLAGALRDFGTNGCDGSTPFSTDVNSDGVVDNDDLNFINANFGASSC